MARRDKTKRHGHSNWQNEGALRGQLISDTILIRTGPVSTIFVKDLPKAITPPCTKWKLEET